LTKVASALQDSGARRFCVSHLEEAQHLREAGIFAPILVMIPLLAENVALAKELNCEIVIDSAKRAEQASYAAPLDVHIKVNTGLNRLGCDPHQASGLALKCQELGLNVLGVMTHFAPQGALRETSASFQSACQAVEDTLKRPVLKHACGSYGLLTLKQAHLDAVRPGTLLYGQWPGKAPQPKDLKLSTGVWRMVSRLIAIRDVRPGDCFGYGRDKVKNVSRLGIVPVGLADGATMIPQSLVRGFWRWLRLSRRREMATWRPREVSFHPPGKLQSAASSSATSHGFAAQQSRQVPIVGRASMQMLFVDLSLCPAAEVGDEIEIPCRRLASNPSLLP